jgi:hypothetical protein
MWNNGFDRRVSLPTPLRALSYFFGLALVGTGMLMPLWSGEIVNAIFIAAAGAGWLLVTGLVTRIW